MNVQPSTPANGVIRSQNEQIEKTTIHLYLMQMISEWYHRLLSFILLFILSFLRHFHVSVFLYSFAYLWTCSCWMWTSTQTPQLRISVEFHLSRSCLHKWRGLRSSAFTIPRGRTTRADTSTCEHHHHLFKCTMELFRPRCATQCVTRSDNQSIYLFFSSGCVFFSSTLVSISFIRCRTPPAAPRRGVRAPKRLTKSCPIQNSGHILNRPP